MPRYRSDDSDDDRDSSRKCKKSRSKKRRARSRSGSDSEGSHMSSSRGKKLKKKYGRSSRSPSPNRGRSSRRSRSRSRSTSYDRYYSSRKSRRSRSRSRSRRRRSRSYSRDRRSRSSSRNRSRRSSPESRGDESSAMKSRMSLSDQARNSPVSQLTPAQQAEERMRQALKAAAAADQKLRQMPSGDADSSPVAPAPELSTQPKFSSYEESRSFANSVAAIDTGNFKQSVFKSSRTTKPQEPMTFDMGPSHDDAIFGSLAVTGFTIKPDPDTKPLEMDPESIIHPNLFGDAEERLDRWIERLAQLRKRKLEGDALI